MANKISSKHMNGKYLIKSAEKAGLKVEYGKGDHVKVIASNGRGYTVIPNRNLGKGLASAIVKWLIAAGVSFSIFILICNFL